MEGIDIQTVMRQTIREFLAAGQGIPGEAASKDDLRYEIKHREMLERRFNEMVEENRRVRDMREKRELTSAARAELQRQGITFLDLWGPAIECQLARNELGQIVTKEGEALRHFVRRFIADHRGADASAEEAEIERAREHQSREERMEHLLEEIARLASQPERGLI